MSRVPQRADSRGSLKWVQRAINLHADLLDGEILGQLPDARHIEWRSPLAADEYSEYRDSAFLERLNLGHLSEALAEFWPSRGPQWDALGIDSTGSVLLVEAKAHLEEVFSPPSQAGEVSLARIKDALQQTAEFLGAEAAAPWHQTFYQLANRLAHLYFLRQNGVDARLVLVGFIGDDEMHGPATEAEWEAAYAVIWHVMGLKTRHPMSRYVIHVYPDVRRLV